MKNKLAILVVCLVGLNSCNQNTGSGASSINYLTSFRDIYIGFFDPNGTKAPIDYVLIYEKGETTGSRPTYWVPGNEITRKRGYLRIKLPESTYDITVGYNNGMKELFSSVVIDSHQESFVINKTVPAIATPAGNIFEKGGSYWASRSNTESVVNVRAIFLDLDREISGGFKNAFAYAMYVGPNRDTTYTQHRMRCDEEGIKCGCEITYPTANPPREIRFRSGVSTRPVQIGSGESENDMSFRFKREVQFDKIVLAHPKPGSDRAWDFSKITQSRLVRIHDVLDIPNSWSEAYDFTRTPREYNQDK